VVVEQPIPGPQPGTGKPEVAERWLVNTCFGVDVTEAAATPATTTEKTNTRKMSFIISYPSVKSLVQKLPSLTLLW
jgi:hypothetical protein